MIWRFLESTRQERTVLLISVDEGKSLSLLTPKRRGEREKMTQNEERRKSERHPSRRQPVTFFPFPNFRVYASMIFVGVYSHPKLTDYEKEGKGNLSLVKNCVDDDASFDDGKFREYIMCHVCICVHCIIFYSVVWSGREWLFLLLPFNHFSSHFEVGYQG